MHDLSVPCQKSTHAKSAANYNFSTNTSCVTSKWHSLSIIVCDILINYLQCSMREADLESSEEGLVDCGSRRHY